MASAEFALIVEQTALDEAPDGRGTVGTLSLTPFSRNVVPGSVQLSVDTRHPSDERLLAMKGKLLAAANAIAKRRGVTIEISELWHSPAMPFDEQLIVQSEECAAARNLPARRIWSGAGHDAVYMAAMGVPTAMLFVPTKDGISHNESESITREHAIAGCQVLCDAVIRQLF